MDGGSSWSVCSIMGNKMAIVGNSLAGGPVKNHPLNVFQLSKHWCLSFLCCMWGEAGASSAPPLPREQPSAAFACFLLYLVQLQSVHS